MPPYKSPMSDFAIAFGALDSSEQCAATLMSSNRALLSDYRIEIQALTSQQASIHIVDRRRRAFLQRRHTPTRASHHGI